jgi:uncharacterized coiled-coil protein SlyX
MASLEERINSLEEDIQDQEKYLAESKEQLAELINLRDNHQIKWIGNLYKNNDAVDPSKSGEYVWFEGAHAEFSLITMPLLGDDSFCVNVADSFAYDPDMVDVDPFTHVSLYGGMSAYEISKGGSVTDVITSQDHQEEGSPEYMDMLLKTYLEYKQKQARPYKSMKVEPVYVHELTLEDNKNYFFINSERKYRYYTHPNPVNTNDGKNFLRFYTHDHPGLNVHLDEVPLECIVYRILEEETNTEDPVS